MRRFIASLAVTAAIALPAGAGAAPLDLGDMSPSDEAAFGERVREYLIEHPEVIMEAIQVLEQRRDAQMAQNDREIIAANADRIYDDGYSWVGGNPQGDITVVEFLDYRCGYCKKAQPEVEALLQSDPNVRLIVKEFPILGPDSVTAGKMALAALELDPAKFGPLHRGLMSFPGGLTGEIAYRMAEKAGYDTEKLRELAESAKIDDRLAQNYQLAQALGLQGTPGFVIGGQIIRGYIPLEEMEAAVSDARVAQN